MSDKKQVHLATWIGPGTFTAWEETFESGVQRQVSAEFAKKMKGWPNLEVIYVEEGSKEDVRVEEYVVPPQEDEPATPQGMIHPTTTDPTPKKEK